MTLVKSESDLETEVELLKSKVSDKKLQRLDDAIGKISESIKLY